MRISYTQRTVQTRGLGEREGPYSAPLGYFLFVEAACYFGVLPPFDVLGRSLHRGWLISASNALLEWQPLRLSRHDYDYLKRSIRANPQWGGEVDENFHGSRRYWEQWAIQRSVDKMSAAS